MLRRLDGNNKPFMVQFAEINRERYRAFKMHD